ncbi:MAG TPA: malto-oligosyltrehalose trehalohydrolase, partial [Pirellulales bacterium]|nr:malto-oligosyltrehalose trehalohydrolase [Pirellulales bacterium]
NSRCHRFARLSFTLAIDKRMDQFKRRLPIGAEVQIVGGVHFRVWAPRRQKVDVVLVAADSANSTGFPLDREHDGYFSGLVAQAAAGRRYYYRLDNEPQAYPDPASRFQPEGPCGASLVVDPQSYRWRDDGWRGASLHGQVFYELHVGAFTSEGTWRAAARQLAELADLGITAIEVMPVAEFAGNFGWGYDGVDLFAPTRLYGTPDDFRAFVDQAHQLAMAVILDVVYNHFGPTDNYAGAFSGDYFSHRHHTDWGDAINFDGEHSAAVREFFIANAGYWIDEYHLDGLRLDAVQAIFDESADHILAAITRCVRETAGERRTIVVAENEYQQARLIEPLEEGGYGLDAVWNDDFHHAARVAMTGHNEHYYCDYQGTPQELISAVKWGYLYQGQWNARQKRRRGSPAFSLPAERFITFLQNHDQVANSGRGLRCHLLTSPGRHRALTALLLLSPGTPLLFQGQEFSASAPFLYFADHNVEIAELVRQGRQESLRNFRSLSGPESDRYFADPCNPQTFEQCKLDFAERKRHAEAYRLHRDLIALRRTDAVFSSQRSDRVHGAVLADEAFVLRFFGDDGDRLLLVNLGRDLTWTSLAEPLLALPPTHDWRLLWSSEDPRYGGSGTGLLDTKDWHLPGHAAIVLCSERVSPPDSRLQS